jgi:hypothetical protein
MHVAVLPRTSVARWARSRRTAYLGAKPLSRKDFSAIPVCGAVRPSASQRQLAQRP